MRNKNFFESVRAAWSGVAHAWAAGGNIRFHWLAAYTVLLLGIWLDLPAGELALVVLTSALVIAAELVNTAVEEAINLAADSFHPTAKVAKDLAAGAVFVAAAAALAVASLLFIPRLEALPGALRAHLGHPDVLLALQLALLFILLCGWMATAIKGRSR